MQGEHCTAVPAEAQSAKPLSSTERKLKMKRAVPHCSSSSIRLPFLAFSPPLTAMEDSGNPSADRPASSRSSQACQRCRSLKTRCLPSPQPGSCQRYFIGHEFLSAMLTRHQMLCCKEGMCLGGYAPSKQEGARSFVRRRPD